MRTDTTPIRHLGESHLTIPLQEFRQDIEALASDNPEVVQLDYSTATGQICDGWQEDGRLEAETGGKDNAFVKLWIPGESPRQRTSGALVHLTTEEHKPKASSEIINEFRLGFAKVDSRVVLTAIYKESLSRHTSIGNEVTTNNSTRVRTLHDIPVEELVSRLRWALGEFNKKIPSS